MKALNVGFMTRKAAMAATPITTITHGLGGMWSIEIKTTLRSVGMNFELGREFDEVTSNGRKCRTTVTVLENKMVTNQRATKHGDKDVVVVSNTFAMLPARLIKSRYLRTTTKKGRQPHSFRTHQKLRLPQRGEQVENEDKPGKADNIKSGDSNKKRPENSKGTQK